MTIDKGVWAHYYVMTSFLNHCKGNIFSLE